MDGFATLATVRGRQSRPFLRYTIGLILAVTAVGCAQLDATRIKGLARSSPVPRQLVLMCRPQVLQLQDGSRSPGVVAQAFLMGGSTAGPVPAPKGRFHFAGYELSPTQNVKGKLVESWTFGKDELAGHQIDHSLGPCYAFWLPCPPSQSPQQRLIVHARFESTGLELEASPVKVLVPGK